MSSLVLSTSMGGASGEERVFDMRCRKHPKYQAKRIPRARCKACWDMWLRSPHRPGPDARAVAEAYDFGGTDAGGRARG
jgi:hypothetical protein